MLSKRQSYAVIAVALLDRFIVHRGRPEQTQRLLQKSLGILTDLEIGEAFGVAPRDTRCLRLVTDSQLGRMAERLKVTPC